MTEREKVNWLCGCGNGALGISPEEIPANCPVCGQEFPVPGYEEDTEQWD